MVWESCVTMNRNWGYCEKDHYFKPASMLIRKLVECTGWKREIPLERTIEETLDYWRKEVK